MRAVHTQPFSPEELYIAIQQAASKAVEDIKIFTTCIEEPANQQVLTNARQSREMSGEDIKSWLVTQHPGWLEKTVETGVKELKLEEEAAAEPEGKVENTEEDVATIVARFGEEHPDIDVTVNPEGSNLIVRLLSIILVDDRMLSLQFSLRAPGLRPFEIDLQPKPTSSEMYNVSSKDCSRLQNQILQAVSKRPQRSDLLYLLVCAAFSFLWIPVLFFPSLCQY